ncbi:hypothetical protein ACQKKK_15450 [Peribacillus sp. NPDC006672]|uniref:hypothetical protein n=1 Tax=Peribacillus sp. NPDC006672 TaxID=3390606 RepID=UPI003CFF62F0
MRDQYVYRDEILEKVKSVAFITDEFEMTLQSAADYYEVSVETIRGVVKRHRSEFNDYGELRLLRERY